MDHQLPDILPEDRYVDENDIISFINRAIVAAEASEFDEAQKWIRAAEGAIGRWEPYDTSDSFMGQGWQKTCDQIKSWLAIQ